VSKTQYIVAMSLSVLIMLGAMVLGVSSFDTLSKADEKGNVVFRYKGGQGENPAHFEAFFPPTFFVSCRIRSRVLVLSLLPR